MIAPRRPRPSGMTLTELLVVIAIILLLSAATLPTAYVAFAERAVSEGANLVQANLKMTLDRASGTGQPQGVRFLPDPDLSDPLNGVIASNRMVTLTTPANYSEGLVIPIIEIYTPPLAPAGTEIRRLAVYGAKSDNDGLPAPPTSWHFNIRQGEKIRIDGTGNEFTIAGPITLGPNGNPERYINRTANLNPGGDQIRALPTPLDPQYEILYLVNGRDDSGDGYVDPHFDGLDNNGDGIIDPGYNGLDDNGNGQVDDPAELLVGLPWEYEEDDPVIRIFQYARINKASVPPNDERGMPLIVPIVNGVPSGSPVPMSEVLYAAGQPITRYRYVITRRPSVSRDAREYSLPGGAVIDFTTTALGSFSERSRVPIDPITGYVDLIFFPDGRVVPSTPYGFGRSLDQNFPFYFLWIAAREDVHPPVPANVASLTWPALPLPRDPALPATPILEGHRRMITISPRSGQSSVSEIAEFGLESQASTPELRNAFRELPYEDARRLQQTGR